MSGSLLKVGLISTEKSLVIIKSLYFSVLEENQQKQNYPFGQISNHKHSIILTSIQVQSVKSSCSNFKALEVV